MTEGEEIEALLGFQTALCRIDKVGAISISSKALVFDKMSEDREGTSCVAGKEDD